MLALKYIFVLLHIITAAAWFGLALRLSGQARAALAAGAAGGQALADEGQRSVRLMSIFIVLTLLFGLGAMFSGGGFGAYPPTYHTSLLLIIILAALQLFVIRPSWGRLRAGLGDGDADAEAARKRIAMTTGIGHLIWLVVLVLMFWQYHLSLAF